MAFFYGMIGVIFFALTYGMVRLCENLKGE